ncbi:MAG: cation diffusion facilitator family transporter [Legionellaceae bacterium]|nr:cation diffusion facilitator family transporter [Legionellaceae bacterium]
MQNNLRYKKAKQITLIGGLINILLGLAKVIGGIAFHSHALVADGVHSFSDLFTDGMVLLASKYGSQEADDNHPYGHQKIETAATLLLAMLLVLAGFGIAWDSIDVILEHRESAPSFYSLPIALISIIANELLFHATNKVGREINSPLLIANAWHHRSDAASSGVVLLGLTGALFGFKLLDPIAAIIIGAMIIKMGISYGWNSVKELVDTGIGKEKTLEIENISKSVNGVQRIHQLRSRMMGKDIFLDVHILVSPYISVSEGHHIAQAVHHKLMNGIKQIKDVTIHVDPEDDEVCSPSLMLPSRHTLEELMINKWQTNFPAIKYWTIHYLDGKISIDLVIDKNFEQWKNLSDQIKNDMLVEPNISIINFLTNQEKLSAQKDS